MKHMGKIIRIIASAGFVIFLSACLFYCMVAGAGAGEGEVIYVIIAAVLSVGISVLLCAGFHYIRHLQKLLKELHSK